MACPQGLLQPEAWPGRVEPAPMGPCLLQVGKSGGEAEAPQCGEGPDQLLNPGPVRLEAKVRDASSPHKSPGHVQDHEPQALGLRLGQLAGQAQALGPGEEILGDGHHLDPDCVVGKFMEGEVAQPRVLGTADAVLHPGMAAVACLQVGEVVVDRVGEEDLVAPPSGSKRVKWAPGCGSSRRQMARVPSGQAERSSRSVSSATPAPPRRAQSWSMASTHASGGTSRMASCMFSVTSKPTEYSIP